MMTVKEFIDRHLFTDSTPEGQRRAVMSDEPLVTVSAGAGSGKTWVLSARYARLLLTDESLLPRDILTITYTEAAALEMRERITGFVKKLLSDADCPLSDARKDAIRRGLPDACISTIHSFASRLIRESGLTLPVDPRSSVISDQQGDVFWRTVRDAADYAAITPMAARISPDDLAWTLEKADADTAESLGALTPESLKDILLSAAEELDGDDAFSSAVGKWGPDGLADLARAASELHSSNGRSWLDMLAWAKAAEDGDDRLWREAAAQVMPKISDIRREAWDAWNRLLDNDELWDAVEAGASNDSAVKLKNFREQWGDLMETEPSEDDLAAFFRYAVVDKSIGTLRGNISAAVKESLDGKTVGEWIKSFPERIKPLCASFPIEMTEEERRLRVLLLRFCAVSWCLWDTMRMRRGLLSFADMIDFAGSALKGGNSASKFRHIMADEFQDTDGLQCRMIERMQSASGASLFAVGDLKQSIYRFRYAEPEIFAGMIGRTDEKGRVSLNVSFRTRAPLLSDINAVFANVWHHGLGRSDVMRNIPFEPLDPAPRSEMYPPERDDIGTTLPPLLIITTQKDGQKTVTSHERLAAALADRISGWVGGGRLIFDKAKRCMRPVRFRDFAVLIRSRTKYDIIEDALARLGIDSIRDASLGYFGRGEVGDAVSLLRAAADMSDDSAVAGWLMSPFSNVSESDAVKCLESLPKDKSVAELIKERHPHAYNFLCELSAIGHICGPDELLSVFDRNRSWLAGIKDAKDRLRSARNIRRAVSIARSWRDGGGLAECADYMAGAVRRTKLKADEPEWHSDDDDAVLLSTIHASKGLEYPAVVIFDTSGGRAMKDSVKASRSLGAAFSKIPPSDKDAFSMTCDGLIEEESEKEEEMRLFYVAATRARESLIVCGLDTDEQEDSWTARILNTHFDAKNYDYIEDIPPDYAASNDKHTDSSSGAAHGGDDVIVPRDVREAFGDGAALAEISATSFALMEWCPFAWRRRYRQGLDIRWQSPGRGAEAESDDVAERGGADMGSLAHELLSMWDLGADDPIQALNDLAENPSTVLRLPVGLRNLWRDDDAKSTVLGWLTEFAESEGGMMMRRAAACGAESESAFREELGATLMVGAIDALWRDDDGLHVADYKITREADAPEELYGAQLDFYALTAMKRCGDECDSADVSLIMLREGGKIISRRVSGRGAIAARVTEAARRAAAGPWDARTDRCGRCPWRRTCPRSYASFKK